MNEEEQRAIMREFIDQAIRSIRGSADDLRAMGMTVAVHNDYRQDGKPRTFWLLTRELGCAVHAFKGEGETDGDALDQIRRQVGASVRKAVDS